ncbi:hypothetical protein SAMN05216257_10490 [Meinhardsimonia xiamenensis]|jgi:hypothetical protein|uniref:Uncharacterized protein n=1 Tax=Meinhardsimonia xiamenensis TaxID=990712 RepID=A0A1G9DZN8_9RHOB|nr:hypothetical protein [Meinhardsimonia xiamenensis]PRX29009.1 hypothetical protein LV81_02953 [Meinhardsimonia xiamenensis]SDK69325.1 hypothetical protein SAMN05216257_10490 [Meinhardsimonia xiamenensis]
MSALETAIRALFADRNMADDATWLPGGAGPGIPVRIIRARPEELVDWQGTVAVGDGYVVRVPVGSVPDLAIGDRFEIGGETVEVVGEPRRDERRLVWTAEVRPV